MKWTNRLGKWLLIGGSWSTTALALGAVSTGCLTRPVGTQPPTTKVNFTNTVSQQAVDKVDLLFAIDNSASMGDKQSILAEAVPDLIRGLLNPRCVDPNTGLATGGTADPAASAKDNYGCASGQPEFKPVTDMHIGVVSSSLGNFGGDVCDETNVRSNDKGRLLNIKDKKKGGGEVENAKPGNFLSWFPTAAEANKDTARHPKPANPIETNAVLATDFTDLVAGVDQTGCGLEAQLESVYRFLIQPDPWDKVTVPQNASQATLGDGVDLTVLQQRADFLRPDSLVAIIMLTDEDDSSADPLAVNGQGWAFMSKNFPGSTVARADNNGSTAPRGTTACDTDPGSEACTSCAFNKGDAACAQNGGFYGADDDELNVRFHRMKQRYGIDPQYPVKRYVDGFTKLKVPDRAAEHVIKDGVIAPYTSTGKCTNPLFASELPTQPKDTAALCDLPASNRSPDLIFFAVVGGVPNQLLHFNAEDPEASRITNEDWVKILGRDSANFDYDGIDPHMIQSVEPRPTLSGADLPRGNNGTDPFHGREWKTAKGDLQYACTFPLPVAMQRECTKDDTSCDCTPGSTLNPPLCDSGNKQTRAKAYPTIREFQVVRALGEQGVVASLCPIQLDNPNAPDYGYRPAVAAIIDRLKNALTSQCLPQPLRAAGAGAAKVPCLVLAQLEESDSCAKYADQGLKEVENAEVLRVFREARKAESGNTSQGGVDLSKRPVCELEQTAVDPGATCQGEASMAWCYVERSGGNSPAGPNCAQGLIFSTGTANLPNAKFYLQCINQFAEGEAAGDQK